MGVSVHTWAFVLVSFFWSEYIWMLVYDLSCYTLMHDFLKSEHIGQFLSVELSYRIGLYFGLAMKFDYNRGHKA